MAKSPSALGGGGTKTRTVSRAGMKAVEAEAEAEAGGGGVSGRFPFRCSEAGKKKERGCSV